MPILCQKVKNYFWLSKKHPLTTIDRWQAIKCFCQKKLVWKSFFDTILQSRSLCIVKKAENNLEWWAQNEGTPKWSFHVGIYLVEEITSLWFVNSFRLTCENKLQSGGLFSKYLLVLLTRVTESYLYKKLIIVKLLSHSLPMYFLTLSWIVRLFQNFLSSLNFCLHFSIMLRT